MINKPFWISEPVQLLIINLKDLYQKKWSMDIIVVLIVTKDWKLG